jgi:hypothetical protein
MTCFQALMHLCKGFLQEISKFVLHLLHTFAQSQYLPPPATHHQLFEQLNDQQGVFGNASHNAYKWRIAVELVSAPAVCDRELVLEWSAG